MSGTNQLKMAWLLLRLCDVNHNFIIGLNDPLEEAAEKCSVTGRIFLQEYVEYTMSHKSSRLHSKCKMS